MNEKIFDVVVIGCIGIDTNIFLYGNDIDFNIEANFSENLDYIGQAGGYASRGFAKLGYKTAFIGYVGNDFMGKFIKEALTNDGIDISGIFIDPKGTNRSINFMYKDGRRKNFYDGKDNYNLIPDLEICENIIKISKIAHFNIPNWARYLLPIAKKHNTIISCDIQDIVDINDSYRKDFIEYSDVLFLSSVNFPDPKDIIKYLLNQGNNTEKIVICGMGEKGCALGYKDKIEFYPPISMDREVIDTNGAGDGLVVGFITSYFIEKYSLEDSILRGQIVARYTCSLKANTDNLITKNILDNYYKFYKK